MLDEARPYADYTYSGLPWLGQVPGHWGLARGGALFSRADRPVRPGDETVTCFRDGTVTLRKNRRLRGYTEAIYELGYQGIRKGDLIIHAMDAFAGAIGVSDSDGKGSPIYGVCVPKSDANPYFYAHVVREMARTQWILALSRGIRERSTDFRFEGFATQFVPVPPPAEQAAIVRFLSALDRRVNRFVRAKRRLIELLTEQKQAIITHAVTRGLNPNAKLKPSGIDWLGDVPEHWEVKRIKYLLREVDERSADGSEPHLSMSQRHGLIESDSMSERRLLSDSYAGGKLCRAGDLVLNRLKAHLGVFAIAPKLGVISPDYTVLRPVDGANVQFLELVLRSNKCRPELRRRAKGIVQGFWRLYTDDLYAITLPVPPPTEQVSLVADCVARTSEINAAVELAHREIALIREYRTRLVSDVVTGKLDVRAAAERLPDDAVESADVIDTDDTPIDEESVGVEDTVDEVAVGGD